MFCHCGASLVKLFRCFFTMESTQLYIQISVLFYYFVEIDCSLCCTRTSVYAIVYHAEHFRFRFQQEVEVYWEKWILNNTVVQRSVMGVWVRGVLNKMTSLGSVVFLAPVLYWSCSRHLWCENNLICSHTASYALCL